ncbi:hypothetical protein BT96DRAFT_937744 [Gymnopus androsaceus JB14]|uniref:Uncharacterized protein n=1 Tax=Gymnopus androsaceus JB14 TaxID=1447944 RepID=A0A6A4HRI9_9AGAR|nr:hypothetical protein BT96DRAFT_937744 [Gymnopus androsaceus JB14]
MTSTSPEGTAAEQTKPARALLAGVNIVDNSEGFKYKVIVSRLVTIAWVMLGTPLTLNIQYSVYKYSGKGQCKCLLQCQMADAIHDTPWNGHSQSRDGWFDKKQEARGQDTSCNPSLTMQPHDVIKNVTPMIVSKDHNLEQTALVWKLLYLL